MSDGRDQPLNGHCLCGAVTITVTTFHKEIDICHCRMCQRWGGAFYAGLESDKFEIEGEESVSVYKSSDWAERAFCETCGSPLWDRITMPGPMHGQHQVAAGLFENAGGMTPRLEVYIDKKPEGYALEGERRAMTTAEVEAMYAPKEEGDTP